MKSLGEPSEFKDIENDAGVSCCCHRYGGGVGRGSWERVGWNGCLVEK